MTSVVHRSEGHYLYKHIIFDIYRISVQILWDEVSWDGGYEPFETGVSRRILYMSMRN